MAWISLDEVLSSILNSSDERGDFSLLESAREDEEGQIFQPILEISFPPQEPLHMSPRW